MDLKRKSWKQWALAITIAAVTALLFWTLVLMMFEEKFIFFPAVYPEGLYKEEARVLHPEDHFFTTEEGLRLHGWFVPSEDSLGTILLFHGNAGNLSHRGEILRRFRSAGFHVFIFDYRGYGRSEGSPDESGVYADGRAAAAYVKNLPGVDSNRVVFCGVSLGGAVAVDVATHSTPAAMILESTFSSARDVAAHAYPFLPAQYFLRTKFDSESKIGSIHVPLLFFHGTDDSIIPIDLGRKLFDAANEPKFFEEVPGAGHNNLIIIGGNTYQARINAFLLQFVGPRVP